MLCEYGCGRKAKYLLKFSMCKKRCCEKTRQACPANKVTPWNKGKSGIYTEETIIKMRNKKKGIKLSNTHKENLSKASKGKPKSESHKQNISVSLVGRKFNEQHKNKLKKVNKLKFLGKFHTEKTKLLMSEKATGRKLSQETKTKISISNKGKNLKAENPNWRGGISIQPYPLSFTTELKGEIKNRDQYRCYECRTQNRLCVHHIDYDKKNCDKNNLITLCITCHPKTNFNRKKWTLYFSNILLSYQ